MGTRYFGTSVPRLEDPRLLAGQGRYVDDIAMPGMVHAAFVRSPFAHARIGAIDISAASDVEGVVDIYTMADFADLARGPMPILAPSPLIKISTNYTPLAVDEVCHVGEAMVMVIATSRAIAEDAARLIEVSLEELPVIADARTALAAGAAPTRSDRPGNLAASMRSTFGDVEAVFARADHRVSETFAIHRGGCHSMECRGVLASLDAAEGNLTLWTSSQSPYLVRRLLAAYLGRDENALRVIAPDVGGGFGPKGVVYPEEFALALAALKLGRPVKWIEDREEHFSATTQQRDQYWTLEAAFTTEGRITGLRGHCIHDNGAYLPYGLILPATGLGSFPGPYALEAMDLTLDVALTNLVPTTPVRGAARPNAAFLLERMADRVARALNLPREEVRRRSFIRADQMPYVTGTKARDGSPISYDSGDYQKALDLVLDKIGAKDFATRRQDAAKRGKWLGLGMASCVEDTGLGPFEGATIRVTPAGKVIVLTGAASQGQGHRTVFSQIVADVLGVSLDQIVVEAGDTGKFPLGISTIASRIAVTAGSSVEMAAQKVKAKALRVAAQMLEASVDDLTITNGFIHVSGVQDMGVKLGAVAQSLAGQPGMRLPAGEEPDLAATAYFESNSLTFAYGANACEVEIDPETGHVAVTRYVVVHDCGRLINPLVVDGQIRGGVVHGIGNALFERMKYDSNGQPQTITYADYLLPTAPEMPNIEIHHLEIPSPRNPLGVKGAGEGGTIPAAACVISAIEDALGAKGPFVSHHPVSPEEVLNWVDRIQQP